MQTFRIWLGKCREHQGNWRTNKPENDAFSWTLALKTNIRFSPFLELSASVRIVDARNTPCCHVNASEIRGTPVRRRVQKMIALNGTPLLDSHCACIVGQFIQRTATDACGCSIVLKQWKTSCWSMWLQSALDEKNKWCKVDEWSMSGKYLWVESTFYLKAKSSSLLANRISSSREE